MARYLWYIDSAPYIVLRIHEDALPSCDIQSLDEPLQHQDTAGSMLSVHLVGLMLAQCVATGDGFGFVPAQGSRFYIAGMDERWQGTRIIAIALQSLDGAIF